MTPATAPLAATNLRPLGRILLPQRSEKGEGGKFGTASRSRCRFVLLASFVFPLLCGARPKTTPFPFLAAGIDELEIEELCRVATRYVRHAIDEIPRMDTRPVTERRPSLQTVSSTATRPRFGRLQAA